MEKIKIALEKAKAANASTRSTKKGTTSSSETSEVSIKYSQTKTLALKENKLSENRIIIDNEYSPITDYYNVLRTKVKQLLKANNWNSLAITSPRENCGKTLTALNLAISLSKEVNNSVLLVDLDLRKPSIHTYLSDESLLGISDHLLNGIELENILINPGIERLVILPGNERIANSSEMLSSPKCTKLIDELKNRYSDRVVIFDMPPILSCDDVIAFAPFVDSFLIVVEDGITLEKDLKSAYSLLQKSQILGTVLNKSNEANTNKSYY